MSQSSLGGDGGATTLLGLTDTPSSWGTSGQVLKVNSGANGVEWAADNGGSGGISNVSEDTSPQLGGDLDVNGYKIVSESNGDIVLEPNGTGNVGVGTANPSDLLHLSSSSPVIRGQDTDGGAAKINFGSGNITLDADYGGSASSSIINFKVDGTERMRITSDGLIGLGSSSPSSYYSNANDLVLASNGHAGITIKTGTAYTGWLVFADGTASGDNTRGGISYDHNNNLMAFRVDNDRKAVIDSVGSLGIGTSAPSEKLHVNSGQENTVALFESTDTEAAIQLKDDTGTATLKCRNDFRFYNNSGELARINSSGNLGIGTSSPSSPNSVNKYLHIHDSAHSSLVMSDDSNTWEIVSNNALTFRDGTDTRLTIDTSGNVGIGTTSPSEKLHCNGHAIINNTLSGSGAYLKFNTLSTGGYINWQINGSEKMRIDSSGNVGIGTSSPDTLVEAAGSDPVLTVRDTETSHASASSTLRLAESGAGDALGRYFDLTKSGESFKIIDDNGGSPATRLTINSSGNLGISTASPSSIVHASQSTGLNFQANSRAFFGSLHSTHFAVVGSAAKADDSTTSQMVSTETALSGNGLPSAIKLGAGNIDFHTASSSTAGAAFDSLRMRITADGSVGVGGTPAAERLEIINSGADTAPALRISNDAQSWNLATRGDESDNFVIRDVTGGSNVFTLEAGTSECGIGTVSPSSRLHVYAGSSGATPQAWDGITLEDNTDCRINILTPDANAGFLIFGSASDNDHSYIAGYYDSGSPNLRFITNGSEALRIDSSGRVGIGTDSSGPQTSLHVVDATDPVIRVQNTSANPVNGGAIHFAESGGPDGFKIQHNGNENQLNFEYVTSSTESTFFTLQRNSGRVTVKKASNAEVVNQSSGTCDLSTANNFEITMSGATTINLSLGEDTDTTGQSGVVKIISDGSAISFTSSQIKWAGGTVPTPSSTSGAVDILAYYVDGTDIYGQYLVGMA